jgi:hypothetical protein
MKFMYLNSNFLRRWVCSFHIHIDEHKNHLINHIHKCFCTIKKKIHFNLKVKKT